MADSPVRAGDRYTHDDLRITITHVDLNPVRIRYQALEPKTGVMWESRTDAIRPGWVKVASGPRPVTKCVECLNLDAEPGQLYCWDCAVQCAGEWAGLSEVDATAKMVNLIEKTEK